MMKAIYVKPSLKVKSVSGEESLLAGSGEGNFTPSGDGFVSSPGTTEVGGGAVLSKHNTFPGNQWDDEE